LASLRDTELAGRNSSTSPALKKNIRVKRSSVEKEELRVELLRFSVEVN